MKVLQESLVLILSFIVIYFWSMGDFSQNAPPFLGILIASYLILSLRKKGKGFITLGGEGPWGIFLLNTIIFVLVFSTSSINSPLFFLLYFLSFAISFVFEPITTFIFVLGAVIILLPDTFKVDLTNNILKLSSFVLISPLAYFFGKEYRKNQSQEESIESLKERTTEAADTISKDLEAVIKNEKQNLKQADVEKINEALEETEDLRAESKL
jgi:hypothetical protein